MPCALRFLFATILVYCNSTELKYLWEKFETELCQDFHRSTTYTHYSTDDIEKKKKKALEHINKLLKQMEKNISDYYLVNCYFDVDHESRMTREIQSEKKI